jgi:hypothetical protein
MRLSLLTGLNVNIIVTQGQRLKTNKALKSAPAATAVAAKPKKRFGDRGNVVREIVRLRFQHQKANTPPQKQGKTACSSDPPLG